MKITETLLASDADAVIEHALCGTCLDPEIARRVRERSEQATEQLRRKYGTLDVAAALVREVRAEE